MSRKERLLHLKTTDDNIHLNNNKFSSFTVTFKNPDALGQVPRMEPVLIQIPNLFDNINKHNNLMVYTVQGVKKERQLSTGYKTVAAIMSEVAAIINTDVVAAGGAANSINITQNPSAFIHMSNASNATVSVELESTWKSVFPLLGLPFRSRFVIPVASTALPILPNPYPPGEVLVHCVDHAQHYSMSEGKYDTSVIAHCSMQSVPYGGMTLFTNNNSVCHSIPLKSRDVSNWTFKLTDGEYNDLELPANQRVHIYMKIYNDDH